MKIIGAHVTSSKGLHMIQREMSVIGADTCAVFLKNQRRFVAKPLHPDQISKFKRAVCNPSIIVPHGSYLINLANPDMLERSFPCFIDDIKRCHALGIGYYNMHPGSDVKYLNERAYHMIATSINKAISEVPDVVILLECMAGQGMVCGRTFEELALIIEHVDVKERIGVTLDTCHMFGAGYDIRTSEKFEKVMNNFDEIVGLKYLKAMHLNDSKCELGSRKDSHEQIGKGHIGLEAFRYIMNSAYFENIPLIVETPDSSEYKQEIALLRSLEQK